jgi:hypothetical protein
VRRRRGRRVRGARRRDAHGLRQPVLQEPDARDGAAALRPEDAPRLAHGRLRRGVRQPALRDLHAPVRAVHAPPQRGAGAHRRRGRRPPQVLRARQLV